MFDVHIPVVLSGPGRPPFHSGTSDLNGQPATTAHQMVMMDVTALTKQHLAVATTQDVDLADFGHALQIAVDGGQAYLVAVGS